MKNAIGLLLLTVLLAMTVVKGAEATSISLISQLSTVYSYSNNGVYSEIHMYNSTETGVIEVSSQAAGGELAPGFPAGAVWGEAYLENENYFDTNGDFHIDVNSNASSAGGVAWLAPPAEGQSWVTHSTFFSVDNDTTYEAWFENDQGIGFPVGNFTLLGLNGGSIVFDKTFNDGNAPLFGSLAAGDYGMHLILDTLLLEQHGNGFGLFGVMSMNLTIDADPPAPVPEPASVFLLATGLTGLVGARMRRKKI